jgi:hypothetical protein
MNQVHAEESKTELVAQAENSSLSLQTHLDATGNTVTTIAPAPETDKKKWSLSLTNESSSAVDVEQGQRIGDKIKTTSYLGGTYELTKTEKLGLRQYFVYTYERNSKKNFKGSDIKQSFTVPTISTEWKGFLGSEKVAPLFYYYLPGKATEQTNYNKQLSHFYGLFRADVEVAWVLNPRWSVSYYVSPRQSFGATEPANKDLEFGGFEATSRLVHYANLYYNLSDTAQIYFNMGFDNRLASERLTSTSDTYVSALGAAFSFFKGKFIINPEANTSVPLKAGGKTVSAPKYYQTEDIAYTLTTAIIL